MAKQPLSFRTITNAIDTVEASVREAAPSAEDAGNKNDALRFLEDLRGQIAAYCVSKGEASSPKGPEFIPFRGV